MGACCGNPKPTRISRVSSPPPSMIKPQRCPLPPPEGKSQPTPAIVTPSVPAPEAAKLEADPADDKALKESKIQPKASIKRFSCLEEEKMNKTLEEAFKISSHKREKSSFANLPQFLQENPPTVQASAADSKPLETKESCPRQSTYLLDGPLEMHNLVRTLHEGQMINPVVMPSEEQKKKIPAYVSVCSRRGNLLTINEQGEDMKHNKNISTTDTHFNNLLYKKPEKESDGMSMLERKEIVSILASGNYLKSYIRKMNAVEKGRASVMQESMMKSEIEEPSSFKDKQEPILGGFYSVPPFEVHQLLSLDKREIQRILESASEIMNEVFPVWSPLFESQKYYICAAPTESTSPSFRRINELSGTPQIAGNTIDCCTIKQGKYPTTPLVCAMISIANYRQFFKKSRLDCLLYPRQANTPIFNQYGKYGVRIKVNGTDRLVELDDLMPFDSDTKELVNTHTENKNEFWAPLIERAIIKLYRSALGKIWTTPSIEIFHLIGWIPELVMLKDISDKENLWARLYQNILDGNIMLSIGTSEISDPVDPDAEYQVSASTSLLANHTYAIIAAENVNEGRFLKCKNPWGRLPPKLPYHPFDTENWTPELCRRLRYVPPTEGEDGIFWITWEDLVNNFTHLCLAWNPALYPIHKTLHEVWSLPNIKELPIESKTLEYSTQFLLSIPPHAEDFEVRVVLEKHVKDFELGKHRISFMLFNYDGYRIVYPINALREHPYSSREIFSDVFIFENSPEIEQYIFVILMDSENCVEGSFTLNVYSFVDMSIKVLPPCEVHDSHKFQDKWGPHPGGELLSSNFVNNPQYQIELSERTHLQIKASCATPQNISLLLVNSGKDIRETDFDNLANNMSSGQYFTSFAYFEAVLDAGPYTLVLSSQEDSIISEFALEVNRVKGLPYTAEPLKVERIIFPEYEHKQTIHGEWNKENSKGTYRILTDNFQVFFKNPGYVFQVSEQTELVCNLKPCVKVVEGKDIPSTCIAVYEIMEGLCFNMIYEDDSYAGRPWGYFTRRMVLPKNELGYLLLCVTFERGAVGPFELNIMSDHKIESIIQSKEYFARKHTKNILGNWTKISAGGCTSEPTFALNPQYSLRIDPSAAEPETDILLELTSHNQYPVGISLLELPLQEIKPIHELDAVDVSQIKSNASFLVELNTLQARIKKDMNYVAILSTYAAGQLGYFDFKVDSDMPLSIEEIKVKSYTQKLVLEGQFAKENNKGPMEEDDFENYARNPTVFMQANMITDVRIHLYSKQDLLLRVDLYEISDTFEYNLIANSGTYSPLKMGVFIEKRLQKRNKGYLAVCSCYDKEATGEFTLEIEANPKVPRMLIQDFASKVSNLAKFTDEELEVILAKSSK